MFFVIIYSAIDQGYIGLSLASCHKDEIWDLRAELGLIWDHFRAFVPIGTKSQIWDLVTSTACGYWIASQNEKVGRFLDICISYQSPKCWSEQLSAIEDELGVNEELNRETNSTRNIEQFDLGGMICVID